MDLKFSFALKHDIAFYRISKIVVTASLQMVLICGNDNIIVVTVVLSLFHAEHLRAS